MRKPLAVLLGAVVLLSLAPAAQASYPGLNGKIAFHDMPGSNTDQDIFVMEPNASGQTAITGPPENERGPVWSPDGAKIAFDLNGDVYVMNADGSGVVNLTPGTFDTDSSPTWSPDGSQIAFVSTRSPEFGQKIHKMDADGSDVTRVTDGLSADSRPAWSPKGDRIAFVRGGHVCTVKPDGTDFVQVTSSGSNSEPDWSPSAHRIVYTRSGSTPATAGIHTIDPDGANDVDLTGALNEAHDPAWSPDGSKILVKKALHVWTMNANGTSPTQITTVPGNYSNLNWQPLPYLGYARPRGASPLRVPFVPAYAGCAAPNRTHGPPLAFGSCSPPSPFSPNLTVGTPDANSAPANSVGSLMMRVAPGAPAPPSDTQVWIDMSMTDVRCAGNTTTCGNANTAGGADYTGELEVRFTFQSTDKLNGPNRDESATSPDYTFHMAEPCSQTADVSTGAHCGRMSFSMDAVVPGIVLSLEGKRAMWQVDQVRVYDGGTDGDGDTTGDNTLFAVQGLFVP